MRAIAMSIKRLYDAGKLDIAAMKLRVAKGTLTEEEYAEITGKEYAA